MSGSHYALQHCINAAERQREIQSEIDKVIQSMRLTSLIKTLDENVKKSDPFYSLCLDSFKAKYKPPKQCEQQECPSTSGNIWNTIIVNQTPPKINGVSIDRKKFIALFSQYGTIKHAYLCESQKPPKPEKLARIIYTNEEDAQKVWKASQKKMIKYDNHVLVITLASGDYCPIENLPDRCLRNIFLHISSVQDKFNVELVCKRWNAIGRESWSSVTKVSGDVNSHNWKTIISRTTESIRSVDLAIMGDFEDREGEAKDSMRSVSLIAEHLEHLERFVVSMCLVDSSLFMPKFRTIISKNKSLKRLCLWYVTIDEGFIDLLSPEMEEIQINLTDRGCNALVQYMWNLSRFQNLQILGLFNFYIDENQLDGLESLSNLRVLKLKESWVHPSNIEKIVNLTKLEHLSITESHISDVILSNILKNNKNLKHLDISDTTGLTDLSFEHVFQLPHLQVLLMKNLKKVTDKYFTAMPSLQQLNCNGCTLITDVGIQRLFTPDSALTKLCLADCSITLEVLEFASNWAPHERRLTLIGVNAKLDEEWKYSGLKKLISLDRTYVFICQYEEGPTVDPIEDDWREIACQSV